MLSVRAGDRNRRRRSGESSLGGQVEDGFGQSSGRGRQHVAVRGKLVAIEECRAGADEKAGK